MRNKLKFKREKILTERNGQRESEGARERNIGQEGLGKKRRKK